jgi:hypothetical protein
MPPEGGARVCRVQAAACGRRLGFQGADVHTEGGMFQPWIL